MLHKLFLLMTTNITKVGKIVLMVILPYLAPEIEFSDKLTKTARGNSGFGSSGR